MVVVFVRMELSLLSLAVPPLLAATWAPLALLESVQLLLSELSVVELSELSDVELSELSEDQLLVCVLLSVKFAVWVEVCVLVELSELSVVWVYVELSVAVPPHWQRPARRRPSCHRLMVWSSGQRRERKAQAPVTTLK